MFLTALLETHRGQQCSLLPSLELTEGNNVPYCPLWKSRRATFFLTVLFGTHGGQHTSLPSSLELTECNNVPYCPHWNSQSATYFFTDLVEKRVCAKYCLALFE